MQRTTMVIPALCLALQCGAIIAGPISFLPVSACPGCSTQAIGINNSNLITGSYADAAGNVHSYSQLNGVVTSFDPAVPGGMVVFSEAGHASSTGRIAGDYVLGSDGVDRPFIRNADGSYVLPPNFVSGGATATVDFAVGVNASGLVTGSYTFDPNQSTGFTGFIYNGSAYTSTFSFPGALVTDTFALDINNGGVIVGSFKKPGEEHGFIRAANGTFTQVDVPGSIETEVFGINNNGDIVGRYLDSLGIQHGFERTNGIYIQINYSDPSHDPNTYAWGINDAGRIVGDSVPGDPGAGPFSAFVTTPEPEALWMTAAGLLACLVRSRFRKSGSDTSNPHSSVFHSARHDSNSAS